uniref:J domain-containing protein n=1 Tax=Setaria digitata TaxID=48799 RepID=A0A915PHB6_9BILA
MPAVPRSDPAISVSQSYRTSYHTANLLDSSLTWSSGMPSGEDAASDDEDDFFGNPLKHLMPKVINVRKSGNQERTTAKGIAKGDSAERDMIEKEITLGDLKEDDDEVLMLVGKKKAKEDPALSTVEREIRELEVFSNISALPSSGLNPTKSSSTKMHSKRRRKVIESNDSKSPANSIIIDDDIVVDEDDNLFAEEKLFIVEPHCSIEIGDLEGCDTYIKRWKMSETFANIVKLYASSWSCSPGNVILSLRNGKRISAEDTPRSVAFSEKDVNYLSVYKNNQNENQSRNQISIKWLLPERNKPIITAVSKDTPFIILKREFAVDNNLDEEKLTLVFDNERINPQETVSTLGIEDDLEMFAMIFRYDKLRMDLYHCLRIPISTTCLYSTSTHPLSEQRDLYQILGIESSATAKEIKAAYYQLSKIYHPDRHDEAYEVLSSEEKRKAYDKKYHENWTETPTGSWPTQIRVKKNFDDLGLDYKTFEDFQRSVNTRKQQTRHDHWQMPDEFFTNFGSRREFTNTFRPRTGAYFTYSYKDPMQRQREMREWQILKEIEEEKRKSKYKTPTFMVLSFVAALATAKAFSANVTSRTRSCLVS